MIITRRTATLGLGASLISACSPRAARSDEEGTYPSKDIDFIIPVASGGGLDILSRSLGTAMEKALPGRASIVPVNVASGGGGKGVKQLFRAKPDGYTIGILNIPGIFILQQVRKIAEDFNRFAWIGNITLGRGYAIAVSKRSDIRDFEDLLALSRIRPITFAATGPEGSAYTATKIVTEVLGIPAAMVTGYRSSSDYAVGAMRGDTDALIATIGVIGRMGAYLRTIASLDAERHEDGIPNAIDLGHPELADLRALRTLAAPPGTPPERLQVLYRALAAAARDPFVSTWANQNDSDISISTPDQTARLIDIRRDIYLDRA